MLSMTPLRTRSRRSTLEAWVWRIVLRCAQATRRSEELVSDDVDELTDFAHENGRLDEDGLRALIAALPERQRQAVFLRHFADLDYQAIATVLGVKVGTVSATLNAAHTALRHALQEAQA